MPRPALLSPQDATALPFHCPTLPIIPRTLIPDLFPHGSHDLFPALARRLYTGKRDI